MKIGIFNPYMDDLGGGEKYMATIAECLSSRHDVTVFWDNKEDVQELLNRFSIDLSRVRFARNIFSSKVGLFERLWQSGKYDTIIVLSDGSIPMVFSKKLFVHFQQPMPHIQFNSLKTKFKLSRVTSIFCNSYFTKSFIDKSFGFESKVIYPPVDLHPKKVKKENIILTVGRLRVKDVTVDGRPLGDYKKQTVMLEVFKKLVEEGLKEWRFVVAVSIREEDRETFNAIKEKVKGYPIEFEVNKPNRQLWDIYNRAKIYWHAAGHGENLDKHPEYAEHFGISTVEAMGGGAVPVVFNAGGQKEIVDDGENGYLWDTISELKEKTMSLLQNPKKLLVLSRKTQTRVRSFGKERFCRQIYELVEA